MKQKVCLGFIALIMLIGVTLCLVACDDDKHNHNLTHVEEAMPTCSEDGNIEYWYCKDCGKYFSDSNAEVEIMANDTIIAFKGHNYGDWTIIKPATCTEEGKRSKECSVCHDVVEETIAALGHNFSEWKVITPATCTTDGVKERVCSVCGYKDEEVVYATGHDIQNNVCTNCGIKATEGLRFKYVEGNGIAGVFCVGWDDENASKHGYNHSEDEYGSVDLIIPDVYEGYPVIGIEKEWAYSFLNDLCIRSVTLPDSVVYIGDQTFYGCKYLESVSLGASIDYIGTEAFADTALEANIENYDNGLLYINSRDRSSKYLINSQSDLTQATIDDQTKVISSDAFLDSSASLESLTFGTNINFIYDMTFSYCENLHKVYFNGTVDDWMKIYFYSDSANPLSNGADLYLNGVLLTDLNINNISEVGISFLGCTSIQRINLEGVTSIDNKAFLNCINLTDVNLPDCLTSIGYSAFSGCYNLKNIILPKGLESLGRDVFYGCSSLETINLDSENTAFVLKDGVLYNAEMTELVCILQSYRSVLSLPDSVDLKNGDALYYLNLCLELSQIEVSENNLYYKSYNGVVYSTTVDYDYQFMYVPKGISGKIELPDDIVVVSGFANTNISEIILGENTTRVESSAFENCTQLKSVVIPDSVLEIGPSAFMGCTNLTDVVIGNKVKYIGYYAFKDCNLENVTFKHYTGWTNGLTNEVDEEELQNSQKAALLLGDENSDDWVNSGLYVAKFIADGVLIDSIEYELDSTIDLAEPQIPEKIGYTASWEEYSLTGDIIINAIYTPISYHVTFKAGGITISSQTYTVEDYDIEIPTVPEKQGYNGQWDYELKEGDTGDIVINASYEIITYTVTFVADEEIISQQEYTVENYDIIIPAVPEKTGYDAKWQDYTLTTGDITINAIYSIINYKVTFIINDEISAVEYYNVENYNINIPTIPQKVGYEAMWREDPSIDSDFILQEGRLEDIVVTAVYEAILYTVTFIAKEEIVAKETYTVEDYDITIPAVPLDVNYIDYYEGEWEEFELTIGDITVNALYSTKNATKGIEYTLSDDGKSYNVTGYSGNDSYILIPDLYKNKPVLGLEWYSFVDNDTIEIVKISNGITSTMGSVFSNCSNLKTVYVPITLQQTAFASPFNNCPNLENVYCEAVDKPISWSLDMYDSYWQWGYNNNTYGDFTYVTHVGFNGYEAYITSYNGNSNEVSIPTGIGNYAVVSFTWIFSQNNNIERVNIPQTVTSIYDYAFYNCQNLKTVSFDNIFSQIKGIGKYTFANCSSLTNIIIPNSVTTIGYSAFNNCISLESLVFGISLEVIEDYAFSECISLKEIYFEGIIKINQNAFSNCTNLVEVTFGEFVKLDSIGDAAFAYCSSLAEISLPNSVKSIGYGIFRDCDSLQTLTLPFIGESNTATENAHFGYIFGSPQASYRYNLQYVPSSLKKVHITNAEKVAKYAFEDCKWIEEIIIEGNVNIIGGFAFNGCGSLLKLDIPDSVKTIESNAFAYCSSLLSITLPSQLSRIDNSAFSYCSSLKSILIPETVNYLGSGVFVSCSSLVEISLPNNITTIPSSSFFDCSSLSKVSYSNNVTSIGNNAFSNCISLKDIWISANIQYIDQLAFVGCYSLTLIDVDLNNQFYSSVDGVLYNKEQTYLFKYPASKLESTFVVPNSVVEINPDAFVGSKFLESIEIPENVESSIGSSYFQDCIVLLDINVDENNYFLSSVNGILFNKEMTSLIYYPNGKKDISYQIDENITSIAYGAFLGNKYIEEIIIPDSVDTIAGSVFENCSKLKNVELPKGLQSISFGLFKNCSSLKFLEIPDGVMWIEYESLMNCSSLTTLIIPDSVQNIDEALSGCNALTNVTMPTIAIPYIPKDALKNVVLTSGDTILDQAFMGCTTLECITLPESLVNIGNQAFYQCYHLSEVYNLSSLNIEKGSVDNGYIGYYAVSIYESLESSKLVTTEDGFVFYEEGDLLYLVRYEGIDANIVLPQKYNDKNYEILPYAFSNNLILTSVTIPEEVLKIGFGAFYGCNNLESLVIPFVGNSANIEEKSNFGYIFGANTYLDNSTYVPSNLKNVTVTSASNIGINSFYECLNIQNISLSNAISIPARAFYNCLSLTDFIIPNIVTEIGNQAFEGCLALKTINIPDNVISIGEYAFYKCSNLESISIGNKVAIISNYAFAECSSLINLEMGDNVQTIGTYAFANCINLKSIALPETLKELNYRAFDECRSLTYIKYNAIACKCDFVNQSSVGVFRNAGQDGEGITVEIGSNVQNIPMYLFSGYGNWETPKIIVVNFDKNSNCESIGDFAFNYCSYLKTITYNGTIEEWNAIIKGNEWDSMTVDYIVHCLDGDITKNY